MSIRVQDLADDAREIAEEALGELVELGILHAVTSTTRTQIEQITFYAQGRAPLEIVNLLRRHIGIRRISMAENAQVVTWADGVNTPSNHQDGTAIDVVPVNERGWPVWPQGDDPRWARIAVVMKRHGFAWGGDWPEPKTDRPHYNFKGGAQ